MTVAHRAVGSLAAAFALAAAPGCRRCPEVVRHDVAEALVDADAVLADPDSLLVALRLRAQGVRHPAE